MDFYDLKKKYKQQLLDTGLDAVKTAFKKESIKRVNF